MITISLISALLSTGAVGVRASSPTPACPEAIRGSHSPGRGAGMNGDGWDGPGQNATTIYFHMDHVPSFFGPAGRWALIDALAVWAEVVQIHFVELAVTDHDRSIDFLWVAGDHCPVEVGECGHFQCAFNGPGFGSIAHAFPPPGVEAFCAGVSIEDRAGNVHFDVQEPYATSPAGDTYHVLLVAAHMVGHALGLQEDNSPGNQNVMGPIELGEGFTGLGSSDVAEIRAGYASGSGSVTTLEDTGVWVNSSWEGPELGMPGSPFDTLAEGIQGVPPHGGGVTVHVLVGLYPESITISKACIITSEFGPAIIGE